MTETNFEYSSICSNYTDRPMELDDLKSSSYSDQLKPLNNQEIITNVIQAFIEMDIQESHLAYEKWMKGKCNQKRASVQTSENCIVIAPRQPNQHKNVQTMVNGVGRFTTIFANNDKAFECWVEQKERERQARIYHQKKLVKEKQDYREQVDRQNVLIALKHTKALQCWNQKKRTEFKLHKKAKDEIAVDRQKAVVRKQMRGAAEYLKWRSGLSSREQGNEEESYLRHDKPFFLEDSKRV